MIRIYQLYLNVRHLRKVPSGTLKIYNDILAFATGLLGGFVF